MSKPLPDSDSASTSGLLKSQNGNNGYPITSAAHHRAKEVLNVAVVQMTSTDSIQFNTQQILSFLNQKFSNPHDAVPPALDLILFPENSLYMHLSAINANQGRMVITLDHPDLLQLGEWASAHKVNLHLGSVPFQSDSLQSTQAATAKPSNASLLIRANGQIEVLYHKMHLFDVDVEGAPAQKESDFYDAGHDPKIFEVEGWRIASAICYDLRFGELFAYYARREVDAIVVPSAFLVPTGRAHWKTLLQARAIETQSYVLAAAQSGEHLPAAPDSTPSSSSPSSSPLALPSSTKRARMTYGHSMVIDPWGQILAEAPAEEPGFVFLQASLSAKRIQQVREQIPMKKHRRSWGIFFDSKSTATTLTSTLPVVPWLFVVCSYLFSFIVGFSTPQLCWAASDDRLTTDDEEFSSSSSATSSRYSDNQTEREPFQDEAYIEQSDVGERGPSSENSNSDREPARAGAKTQKAFAVVTTPPPSSSPAQLERYSHMARHRLYPGGSDEQDIKVQKVLPMSSRVLSN